MHVCWTIARHRSVTPVLRPPRFAAHRLRARSRWGRHPAFVHIRATWGRRRRVKRGLRFLGHFGAPYVASRGVQAGTWGLIDRIVTRAILGANT